MAVEVKTPMVMRLVRKPYQAHPIATNAKMIPMMSATTVFPCIVDEEALTARHC